VIERAAARLCSAPFVRPRRANQGIHDWPQATPPRPQRREHGIGDRLGGSEPADVFELKRRMLRVGLELLETAPSPLRDCFRQRIEQPPEFREAW